MRIKARSMRRLRPLLKTIGAERVTKPGPPVGPARRGEQGLSEAGVVVASARSSLAAGWGGQTQEMAGFTIVILAGGLAYYADKEGRRVGEQQRVDDRHHGIVDVNQTHGVVHGHIGWMAASPQGLLGASTATV